MLNLVIVKVQIVIAAIGMLIKSVIIVPRASKLYDLLKFGEEVVGNCCFSARVRSVWGTLILKLYVINGLLVVLILSICQIFFVLYFIG